MIGILRSAWLLAAFSLGAIAIAAQELSPPSPLSPLSPPHAGAPTTWRFVGLPPSKAAIPVTRFEWATHQGERALKVSTASSYGTWVHDLPQVRPATLQWRWRLDLPLTGGHRVPDLLRKNGDDAALKVCVLFEHALDRVPFVERTVLRLARRVSGEDLPAATICYVWDSAQAAGLQGANPYSRRVRFISLQGLGSPLGQWQSEARDVAQDFAHLFADEWPPGAEPPSVRAVLIGADSDNTGARSVGWVQSVQWRPKGGPDP
ncbi:MAG: hypothetical protein RLZZ95_909 [Pseudomonadota bacterium]